MGGSEPTETDLVLARKGVELMVHDVEHEAVAEEEEETPPPVVRSSVTLDARAFLSAVHGMDLATPKCIPVIDCT